MTDLVRWLDSRLPPPPPSLAEAIRQAVLAADPGPGPTSERLATVGLETLRRVVAERSSREHALDLLAADALVTYACEAAVEEETRGDPDALDRLTRALDPARFSALLPGDESG